MLRILSKRVKLPKSNLCPKLLSSAQKMISKLQSRMLEKLRQQQVGSLVEVVSRGKSRFAQDMNVIRNEITHLAVLHFVPARFDRVQLRRIRRQTMKDEPVGMLRLKMSLGSLVSRKTIPNDHHRFFVITMDKIQVANDFMSIRRSRVNRETKSWKMKFRRQRDETDAGLGGSFFTFVQNGTCPRSAQVRAMIGTREKFVSSQKRRDRPFSRDFFTVTFFGGPNVSNPMFDLGRIVFFRLPGRHDRTEVQLVEKFSDMIEMITYMKLPKDQVGDDFGRPTIPIVAARGGSVLKQGFELLLLERRQSAPSTASRFPCQAIQSVFVDFLSPSFERRKRNVQRIDDFIVGRSVENHAPRQKSFLAAIRNPFRRTHALLYERNDRMVQIIRGGQ
jgi:hypothetical protein